MTTAKASRRPAHRPSRRGEIIDAAIKVFGRTGYADASVEDIAAECGVAATAVYYHFGGKEELFDEALSTCLERFSAAVNAVRPDDAPVDVETLRLVVHAGWTWWRTQPEQAQFMTRHAGGGNTMESRRIYQEWLERHTRRAFDYVPEEARRAPRSLRKAREKRAVQLLALRVVVGVQTRSQTFSMTGAAAKLSSRALEDAVADLSVRLIVGQPTMD